MAVHTWCVERLCESHPSFWMTSVISKMGCYLRSWSQMKHVHHSINTSNHDDIIKWKHFPRYWPFMRGIHWSPVNSPHKGQWRGALMFSLICAWINGWVNNGEVGDWRCHRTHYDVTVMCQSHTYAWNSDDFIWKHIHHYWPFVRGIHQWPVNILLKWPVMQSLDVLVDFSLLCWACDHLSMLVLKLIHVSKRGPGDAIWQHWSRSTLPEVEA